MKRWLTFVGSLAPTLLVSATTIIPMSVEQLASKATAVVEAQAISSESRWNAEHTRIYTYTKFRLAKTLRGYAARLITVKTWGGSAEGYTQKIAGVRASWPEGERAVLFLRPSLEHDGTMVVVGLMQGDFRVLEENGTTFVSNGVGAGEMVEALNPATQSIEHYTGAKMTIDQLEQRVRNSSLLENSR